MTRAQLAHIKSLCDRLQRPWDVTDADAVCAAITDEAAQSFICELTQKVSGL